MTVDNGEPGFDPGLTVRNVASGHVATIHREDGTSADFWGATAERARSKALQNTEVSLAC